MPIYHYKDSPLIDRIEVREVLSGATQATIVAADGADPEQLQLLRRGLGIHRVSTMMDDVDDHPAIQVRGVKDEKKLLSILQKLGVTLGEVEKELTESDYKKHTLSERVQQNSLFLSALFYDLGNAAYIVSGIQRGRHNKGGVFTANDKSEMLIGAAMASGDLLMTAYGKHRGDEELTAAADGLKEYLKEQKISIPEGDALNPDSLNQSGAFDAVNKWLQRNISKMKSTSETAAGMFMMHSAVKPGYRNNGKLSAGFFLTTGWLATLLLDKPAGHEIFNGDKPPPASIAEKALDNPRGWFAGSFSMANNFANLWGALNPRTGERSKFKAEVTDAEHMFKLNSTAENRAHLHYTKVKQHDYIWNVISAGSFLIANGLFGLSGKQRPHETEDDRMVMDDLVLMAANTLAQQPKVVREQAVKQTAEYVSKLSHVTLNEEELAQVIDDKIDSLSKIGWVDRMSADPTISLARS